MIRICLAIALLLTVVNPVLAFDPAEHRGLSNEALKLCSRILASRAAKASPTSSDAQRLDEAQKALRFLLKEPDPEESETSEHSKATEPKRSKRPDYGQLVLSVDHYSIAPNTDYKGNRISLEHDFRGYEMFKDRKSAQLGLQAPSSNWLEIGLRRLGAVHTNDIHFQHGAVEGVKYFHEQATSRAAAAANEAELRQAFVLNAIADHLMQDFLAGGHAATPRANFHDLAAAVIHDSYNKSGVPFDLKTATSGWKHLKELVHEIDSLAGKEEELRATARELTTFIQDAEGQGVKSNLFHGDGRLMCNPSQRLYMLLIAVRSVLDVVESFLLREQVDKVESGSWLWTPALAKRTVDEPKELVGQMHPPEAGTSSGRYDLEEIAQTYQSQDGFTIKSLMVAFSTTDQDRLQGALDVELVLHSSIPAGAVILSDTKEDAFKNREWSFIAPGFSYFFSPGLTGFDAHLLVFGPLWGQDNPLSLRFGLGAYSVDGGEYHKKLNAGLSIGKGFGLLYVEMRYERSYVARSGELHGRWAPSLGARLLVPRTWAPKVRRILPPALRKHFKNKCGPSSVVAKAD